MSNEGYHDPSQHEGNPNYLESNNPWAGATSYNEAPSYGQAPPAQQQQQQQQQQHDFTAPSGAPPAGQSLPPSDTFKESDFVPEDERGEQREAMQQFEMNKSGNESQHDKDVAQLQQEFPGLDGSLIAALYGDNGNMGATREMLQELASGPQ